MCNTGSKVTCRVDGITGQSAKGHADGYDNPEYQQFINACGNTCYLANTLYGKYKYECADCLT